MAVVEQKEHPLSLMKVRVNINTVCIEISIFFSKDWWAL